MTDSVWRCCRAPRRWPPAVDALARQAIEQFLVVLHLLVFERDDDVANEHATGAGGALRRDTGDEHTAFVAADMLRRGQNHGNDVTPMNP